MVGAGGKIIGCHFVVVEVVCVARLQVEWLAAGYFGARGGAKAESFAGWDVADAGGEVGVGGE